MNHNNEHRQMLKSLLKLTNLMVECQNTPIVDEEGLTLYPAEQHLMCLLNENPERNVTELADLQGVTKGAISQMVKKLESKGVLERVKTENRKNVHLRLTSAGLKKCSDMESVTNKRHLDFYNIWEQYDETSIARCSEIMNKMSEVISNNRD